jgi:hypothetical protein
MDGIYIPFVPIVNTLEAIENSGVLSDREIEQRLTIAIKLQQTVKMTNHPKLNGLKNIASIAQKTKICGRIERHTLLRSVAKIIRINDVQTKTKAIILREQMFRESLID